MAWDSLRFFFSFLISILSLYPLRYIGKARPALRLGPLIQELQDPDELPALLLSQRLQQPLVKERLHLGL